MFTIYNRTLSQVQFSVRISVLCDPQGSTYQVGDGREANLASLAPLGTIIISSILDFSLKLFEL